MPSRVPADVSRGQVETYRDIRSHHRPANRQSKQSAKYYGYRAVHPSWVDQPYHSLVSGSSVAHSRDFGPFYYSVYARCDPTVANAGHMAVSTWTKQDMYKDREANIWPLDRRHHKGKRIREKSCWKWTERDLGRRTKQKARSLEFATENSGIMALDDDYYRRGMDDEHVFEIYEDEGEVYLDDADENKPHYGHTTGEDESHSLNCCENDGCLEDEEEEDDGFSVISQGDFDVISISSFGDDMR